MSNIRIHLIKDMLGPLVAKEPLPIASQRSIIDHSHQLIGLMRPATAAHYYRRGYRYLVELEIHNRGLSNGLYNCAFEFYARHSLSHARHRRRDRSANQSAATKQTLSHKAPAIQPARTSLAKCTPR